MMFLYGFSLIAITPTQCLLDNNWNLKSHVYSGEFIKYCFRPINIYFYFVSETFDLKGIGQFLFGVRTVYYACKKLHIAFSFMLIAKIFLLAIVASLFMMGIMNIAAAMSFWTVNSDIAMSLAFKLKDCLKYPVTIYNVVIRFIFTFIFPIAYIS